MKVFEYLDRISRIHRMLKNHSTGTPTELAFRLGVSRTSLYEMLDEMRSRGAPIIYSKASRTFYYSEPFDISVTCTFRSLSETEKSEVTGGSLFYPPSFFYERSAMTFNYIVGTH